MHSTATLERLPPPASALDAFIAAHPRETPRALEPVRPRFDSIDLLRGLVMILMVLDHARDFFGSSAVNPRDVHEPLLFLTRWVTHFCAPIFVFLTGVSAFLYGSRGHLQADVSRFLVTRGAWLIFLELTVVKLGWSFSARADFFLLQAIWAIGWSMIALAGIIFLRRWAIAAIGLVLIAGHNLLDPIDAATFGPFAPVWNILHAPTMFEPVAGTSVFALYPLLPWIGVIAAGYAFGPVMLLEARSRRRTAFAFGAAAVALFVILRGIGLYGDPTQPETHDSLLAAVLSFVNCEKYPPSLLYLAMTLGPALLFLGIVETAASPLARAIVTLGRVPMLFYVAHLFVLHAIAVCIALATTGDATWLFGGMPLLARPASYGLNLIWIYPITLAVVAALYPLCHWFAALKQRNASPWLSYL
jgi:uncharacterized membrane protein